MRYIASSFSNGELRLWTYYNKEVILSLHTFFHEIYKFTFTPDNDHIILGSNSTDIKVWNISEKKELPILKSLNTFTTHMCISENGKYFATCLNLYNRKGSIIVWNFLKDNLKTEFICYNTNITSLMMSSDNKYIFSSAHDGSLHIWSLKTKSLIKVLVNENYYKGKFTITKNNKTILLTAQRGVIIQPWSEDQIQEKYYLMQEGSIVNCLAITSDNNFLISAHEDNTLKVWNLIEKYQVCIFEGHKGAVYSLSISTDNTQVLSGSFDTTVRIWDIVKQIQIAILKYHICAVFCVSIYHNSPYAISGSEDKTLIIWDLVQHRKINKLEKHTAGICSLAISKSNKIAISGGFDYMVYLWDLINLECKYRLSINRVLISSLSISQDEIFVSLGSKSGYMHSIYLQNNIIKDTFKFTNSECPKLLCKEKLIVFASDNTFIKLLDVNQKIITHQFVGHTNKISSLAITNDNKYVISGSVDGEIIIWTVPNDQDPPIQSLQHSGHTKILTKTHDKNVVISYSEDKTIRMWNKQKKCLELVMKGHQDSINDVKITKNKKFLISGSSDYTVKIWNLPKGDLLSSLKGIGNKILSIGVDKINKIFVSGDEDGYVAVWDLVRMKKINEIKKHCKGVSRVGISKCNGFIFSGCCDDTVKVWDAANGKEYLNAAWKHKSLSLALSKNNKFLLAIDENPMAYVWKIKSL
ncbi:hypothetical protein SteCoe_17598 [Stentor coeruleus]|uniref:Uncharacterized protein n=1 Tax=Stentor coeruleus TaxID=5963 RepID=A0A1R2BYX8_9CILI|nr:hypothetical protein SteCoe_17598 [Stentor coeruleus]